MFVSPQWPINRIENQPCRYTITYSGSYVLTFDQIHLSTESIIEVRMSNSGNIVKR
jgi:hypothetical protein